MTQQPILLITGATGNQGGAVLRHLKSSQFKLCALTRNPDSPKAIELKKQGVELIKGNLDEPNDLGRAMEGVTAVFSVQTMMGGNDETAQGKRLADAAKKAEVKHFIYSSVDGAERRSGVPHFDSKFEVEQHIRSLKLPFTIFRPVYFMENLNFPSFVRALFIGMQCSITGKKTPVQLVSVEDIGAMARIAFENRENYLGKEIALAGDELSAEELTTHYHTVTGKKLRSLPFPGWLTQLMMKDVYLMFSWFKSSGYSVNISELNKGDHKMMNFNQWLKTKN